MVLGGKHQVWRLLGSGLVLALLTTLWLTPAYAAEPERADEPTTPADTSGAEAVQADDGGRWELGIHGTAGDLTAATAAERAGMNYWLSFASNWQTNYIYNESSAWEEDFKLLSLGGTNESYIDNVDLQFYVGHGWPGGFTFANTAHDDSALTSNECLGAWGNKDNDWFALTSCQVLADSNLSNWARCMNGQHLILGFVTNASAYNNLFSTQAYHFGRYLYYNYSVPQAWYAACDVAQRGRITRTIINELDCLNDRPNYGQVCADSYDGDWWYQTHWCGTETAIQVPLEKLQGQLPVYRVAPYSLDQAESDLNRLSTILLGEPVTNTVRSSGVFQDDPFLVSTRISETVQLDKNSGLYSFADVAQLWTAEQAETALAVTAASPNYISQDDARTIADRFLRQNQLFDTGSTFNEVISDTISVPLDAGVVPTSPLSAASVEQVDESAVLWQVIYARRLTVDLVSAAGTVQEEFSVVGPGAKQKVYVPVTADVTAASKLQTEPIGLQGGWREVQAQVNAATGQLVMVDILPEEQVKQLYLALPDRVALNDVPLDVENREILSTTIAYWEDAQGVSQAELTPVYEFLVRMTDRNSGDEIEDYVYVPASPLYMRPYAEIVSVSQATGATGRQLTLTAADASQTLQTLGEGDFDFALGTGADGDYLYDWFVDGESIGTGRSIVYNLPSNSGSLRNALTIELRVTNADSPNTQSATDSVTVEPSLFLPLISGSSQD
jgi:hypothetical protein